MPHWYKAGTGRNGTVVKPLSRPKARLTATQVKVLQLFLVDDKPKTMLDALATYNVAWPSDEFTTTKMSRDLKELKQDDFLVSKVTCPSLVNKHERSYVFTEKKKMVFWLSEQAKTGKIAVDANRWVLLDGCYIAPETTRRRTETREKRKAI